MSKPELKNKTPAEHLQLTRRMCEEDFDFFGWDNDYVTELVETNMKILDIAGYNSQLKRRKSTKRGC
jgi:hypothetical protein